MGTGTTSIVPALTVGTRTAPISIGTCATVAAPICIRTPLATVGPAFARRSRAEARASLVAISVVATFPVLPGGASAGAVVAPAALGTVAPVVAATVPTAWLGAVTPVPGCASLPGATAVTTIPVGTFVAAAVAAAAAGARASIVVAAVAPASVRPIPAVAPLCASAVPRPFARTPALEALFPARVVSHCTSVTGSVPGRKTGGNKGGLNGWCPPRFGVGTKKVCPAVSYSPTRSLVQYHRR